MRNKKQRHDPHEIGEHSLKSGRFTSNLNFQIAKNTTASSVDKLEQLNMHVLDVSSDQNLNITKINSNKKSSNRKHGVRTDENCLLGTISEIETVSPTKSFSKEKRKQSSSSKVNSVSKLAPETKNEDLSVDIDKELGNKGEESLFLKASPKEKRCFSASEDNDDDNKMSYAAVAAAASKYKASSSQINRHLPGNGCVKLTNTPGKEKSISDATASTLIDSSALKTSCKNGIFPDLVLSPKMPALKSSWLPFIASGFASHSRRKLISTSSPKFLDQSMKTESFLNLSLEKSSNASLNLDSPKKELNNSFMSYRSAHSPESLSNQTFSGNDSLLETPKTPESLSSTEIQPWKQKWSMSDVGPRHYQKVSGGENQHSSSRCLHASLLDTPPSARHQKRLLDNSHLFPKRYSHVFVEKYQSFQHRLDQVARRSDWKSNFMNRCWSLRNNFIDSHCHLDFLFDRIMFDGSFQKYYRKNLDSFPSNFAGCVAVFCEPKSFTSEGLWKMLVSDNMVWLAMGCHPKKATRFTADAEKGLADCLKNPKVAAVGEIGLDYSGRFFESAETQKKVFICQIKMALAIKKPLVIHCRDAQEDCLQILKKYVPSDYRIHCHCFTKSFDLAKEWLSSFSNLYIGLTPLVTYPSAKEVHDTARKLPLERLLLETDTPYFVPKSVPRDVKFSHPGMAIFVAFEVAKLKGIDVETVLEQCLKNTKQMYGI